MAREGALTLWKILKEVSVRQIRRDAERRFTLGLIGVAEELPEIQRALLELAPDAPIPSETMAFLKLVEIPSEADPAKALRGADIVLTYAKHAGFLSGLRAPVITLDEGMPSVAEKIFDQRPDLILAIPRRFPAFRQEAAREVVSATSRANTKIAVASALPGVIPVTGAFLPVTSLSDIVILTKNQLILMFKIAAIYGKPLKFVDRVMELLPVVGGAFGWRALARELVGAVPAGIGVAVKGSIAYAGTVAVGKGATLYYQGTKVTQSDIQRFFQQAMSAGQAFVESLTGEKKQQ